MGGDVINRRLLAISFSLLFIFSIACVSAQDADTLANDLYLNDVDEGVLSVSEDIDDEDISQDDVLSIDNSDIDVLADSTVTLDNYGPSGSYRGGKTSNGFTVFCIEHDKSRPYKGYKFISSNNTSIYKNHKTGAYVGDYLKIFIYNYADELMGDAIPVNVTKNGVVSQMTIVPENLMQWIIWGFTDEDYLHPSRSWKEFASPTSKKYGDLDKNPFVNMTLTYVQKVVDDYNRGQRVPNYAYKLVNDTTMYYYEFPAFKSVLTNIQSLFGFKVTSYNVGLKLEKITLDTEVNIKDQVRFILKVTNTGDLTLDEVYIVDKGNDELEYNSFIDNTGKWSFAEDRWVYDGELAPNESANLTLIFTALEYGDLFNLAVAGSNKTTNVSSNNTTHVSKSELKATKVSDDKAVNLGDLTTFIITVINTGEVDLTDVFVKDNVPDGLSYVSYKNGNRDWKYYGGKFFLDGPLKVGKNATLIIIFKTTIVGNFTNQITVGSNQTDNETANDTVEVKDVVEKVNNSTHENSKAITKTFSADSNVTGNPVMLIIAAFTCLIGVRRYY